MLIDYIYICKKNILNFYFYDIILWNGCDFMKKTKIICSIGPASSSVEVMTKMVESGMNVARINFSHAVEEEVKNVLATVDEVRRITGENVAILYDTKGPDFRCGIMQEGGVNLVNGNLIRIVKDNVIGTEESFSVNCPNAIDKIEVGNIILLEDALMKIQVVSKEIDGVTCMIIDGGILGSKKSINVPGVKLDLAFMSPQDIEDIKYACLNGGDFLALSFVENKENILEVRKLLKELNREDMQIISKVESSTALDNLSDIIDYSDGIMVARGDLGVEVPIQNLPIIQKNMIRECREKGKFVIVATEMLASMYTNPRPTRAEVTDISNAVLDGTDAVMLSGESTIGKHPVEAVRFMRDICMETEKYGRRYASKFSVNDTNDITEAIAKAVLTSVSSLDVKSIVVPTTGGHSAKVMSNLRPESIVLAICPNEKVARRLALNYGVYTKVVNINDNDMDDVVHHCKKEAKEYLNLNEKDIIIITGGIHDNPNIKRTNFLKIEEI